MPIAGTETLARSNHHETQSKVKKVLENDPEIQIPKDIYRGGFVTHTSKSEGCVVSWSIRRRGIWT